jgi:hypothetical protein
MGIGLSLAVAEVSCRALEQPVRRGDTVLSRQFARSAAVAVTVVAGVAMLLPTDTADPEGRLDFEAAESAQAELVERQASAPTTTAAPAEPPTPKLATFGDSTALLLGLGMLQYAAESGTFIGDAGDSALGCGVSRFERRRVDKEFGYTEECPEWPTRWAEVIETQRPNIAQLITGSWEVTDALLPGADDYSAIGEPVMDDFIRSELLTAVDVLGKSLDPATIECKVSTTSNLMSLTLSGITAPVGLPGEHTNSNWVLAHTSSGTWAQSTLKFSAGSLGA